MNSKKGCLIIACSIIFLASTVFCYSSLKTSLKLTPTPKDDVETVKNFELDYSKHYQYRSDAELEKKKLKSDDPGAPVFIELKKPFTASPYYDFLDSFLLGLKLDTYFDYATECVNDIVYTIDDYFYF
jgi:hypothetical protein